jgi:hypothetical protein
MVNTWVERMKEQESDYLLDGCRDGEPSFVFDGEIFCVDNLTA